MPAKKAPAKKAAAPKPEPAPETNGEATSRGRGRPRPDEVIARDDQVIALIKKSGPITTSVIAETLEITHGTAYLSVWRLKKNGTITAGEGNSRSPAWVVA